jgi:AcrR family transcriptional regulator
MARDLIGRGEDRIMPRAKRAQGHSSAIPYPNSKTRHGLKQKPVPSQPGTEAGRELPGLRERKKARLRQQIVETALRLFRERGYENTRIDDIVHVLEVSQPTFFRYFPSKDAVLREVGKRGFACQTERLKSELSSKASTAERLRRFYETIAKIAEADRPLWQAVVLAGAMDPVRSPDMRGPEEASVSLLREILAQGQERGDVTRAFPVVHLAEFMEGLFNTVVRQWAVDLTGPHKLSERVRSAVEFFLRAAKP